MKYWFHNTIWAASAWCICSAGAMRADIAVRPIPRPGTAFPISRTPGVAITQGTVAKAPPPAPSATAGSTSERPAKVILKNGLLTVESNNSDLGQILREIAAMSGMIVDGSIRSVRVFGNYGPGNSREVLTDLLRGLGYNFMMVGLTRDGAPKELELTPQSGGAAPIPSSPPASTASEPQQNSAPDEEAPGPGAILHVPPPGPDNDQDRVRQNLQRLKDMHNPPKPPE